MLSGVSSDILESLPDMSQPSNGSIDNKVEIVKKCTLIISVFLI
jgi:hypothetical protein